MLLISPVLPGFQGGGGREWFIAKDKDSQAGGVSFSYAFC
jgi:hypothetical protein